MTEEALTPPLCAALVIFSSALHYPMFAAPRIGVT
jgi:hypothetical protein